ncbi:hypothetical protein [Halomonas alimentaria]|uniref:Uncharacterized protein n=1 Tax=Halomonas alimentaria TaxID=147248 RepID=A0A7X4W646_9GAMM|nr:hypothetical protein [Halomonas alimentaria]NAW34994.1 hypothetical protein [Halomonas alimentaria]
MNHLDYQEILEAHNTAFCSARALAEIAEQEELRQQACGLPHLAEIARREKLKKERREAALDTRIPHAP